jgi:hypothetical protein
VLEHNSLVYFLESGRGGGARGMYEHSITGGREFVERFSRFGHVDGKHEVLVLILESEPILASW